MINPDEVARSSARLDAALAKRSQSRTSDSNTDVYQNLTVVKRLSKAKFPVYLTCSKVNGVNYAMKIFPQKDNKPHPYYRNEIRFSCLKHPNIIDTVFHETEKDTLYKGEMKKVSYTLMEFAPYGDFFDFVTKHRDEIDEKLARTYFKQLIDAIDYMHASRVAHLDLKPENLLLGPNYQLKVADFDLSHVRGDSRILSRGTRYYRAPEFFRTTEEPQLSHPFAADFYSAGIILFILKSGGVYPHSENNLLEGIDLVDLMHNNNVEFWKKHCEIQEKPLSHFDRTFRELFNGMTRERPEDRFTLDEIKQSRWYKGPVYTPEEVYLKMRRIMRHHH